MIDSFPIKIGSVKKGPSICLKTAHEVNYNLCV